MKKRIYSQKMYKALCLGLVGIILVTALVGGALALPTCVYALPPALLRARTIAELIVSLLAGANTAIVNPQFTAPIYQYYGTTDYSIETLIDEGILTYQNGTTQDALDNLGSTALTAPRAYNLDTTAFRNLMYQNWDQMNQIGIDAIMRVGDMANTDSTYGAIDNLGEILRDVASYGGLALENTVAVIANPGTVVRVGLEDIFDAVRDRFGININNGFGVTDSIQQVQGYSRYATYKMNRDTQEYFRGQDGIRFAMTNEILPGTTNTKSEIYYNVGSQPYLYYNNTILSNYNNPNNGFPLQPDQYRVTGSNNQHDMMGWEYFPTVQDALDYYHGVYLGNIQETPIPSPDVIGTYGNSGEDAIYTPIMDNDQIMDIIPQNEYTPMAEDVYDNSQNGEYSDTPIIYNNFINNYIQTIPTPTTAPVVPDQPTIYPKPSIAPEMQEQVLSGTAPNLTTKFPFCLPFDLVNSFKVLQADARAPHFEWNMQIERFDIDETIEIDLEQFTPVAEVLRVLLLLGFIVSLILLTRQIIGA